MPKGQHGSSVIGGEFGLLHGLRAAVNVQSASPGKPGEPTCLLFLRFPVEISTDLMHRVGKKLFLSHFDAPPRGCELFAQGQRGQCWEKGVVHITAFLLCCSQGFVLHSQAE